MKVIRSTRCSIAEATESKRLLLREVMAEYGRVVNHFIDKFWTRKWSKKELLARNIEVPETWFSARLRKIAAREAIDMVASARERGNRKGEDFRCRGCGYTDHADVNAARNLLDRFYGHEPDPTRAYGPGFQRKGAELKTMPKRTVRLNPKL